MTGGGLDFTFAAAAVLRRVERTVDVADMARVEGRTVGASREVSGERTEELSSVEWRCSWGLWWAVMVEVGPVVERCRDGFFVKLEENDGG